MTSVIPFGDRAVASLKARVAAVEEDNRDLVAFARGHAGAVSAIHAAALAAMDAQTVDDIARVVTAEWPRLLGLDAAGFVWSGGRIGVHGFSGMHRVIEPRLVDRLLTGLSAVTLRDVSCGHPLFGAAAASVRAEALIRIDGSGGRGLLALGQAAAQGCEDAAAGSHLLLFLGEVIARMMERCPLR